MNKPRGRPFESGNKHGRGRPKGSRNKTTLAVQQLLNEHARSLTLKCIFEGLNGNSRALRLCIERLTPACRDAAIQIRLPKTVTAKDVDAAEQTVLGAVAAGRLTPSEGESLMNILENRRKSIETVELLPRIEQLERD